MKLFDRYPRNGNPQPKPEARLVAAYWRAIDEYQSLIGIAAKYVVPIQADGKLIPAFDESKIDEVHKIYDQMDSLQREAAQLKQRIDAIDKFNEPLDEYTDIQLLNSKKRLIEHEIAKAALFPEVLKKKQKEYAQINEKIESYMAILGSI